MASEKQAKSMLLARRESLLAYPNVVAVGIGRKNGRDEKSWCIRVHVIRKADQPGRDTVPAVLKPPAGRGWIGEVATDVLEVGATELHARAVRARMRLEPTDPTYLGGAGTCGPVMRGKRQGTMVYYAITAGHVAAEALVFEPLKPSGGVPIGHQSPVEFDRWSPDSRFHGGRVVRCSRERDAIDLALVRLEPNSGPGRVSGVASGYIRSVRDLSRNPLRRGEGLRVLCGPSVVRTRVPYGVDRYVTAKFGYLNRAGNRIKRAVSNLITYKREELEAGNSGGAVVDLQQRLVGIHIGASNGAAHGAVERLGYAIPSNRVKGWCFGLELVASEQ